MVKASLVSKRAGLVLLTLVIFLTYLPSTVSALQIAPRNLVIGSSLASVSTTYAFSFTVPQSTVIKSVSFTACTTPSGSCVPVSGFSSSNSTLTSQPINLGDASGWSVDNSVSNELKVNNTSNISVPTGTQEVGFSNVTNPSTINSTFFIRIKSYSDATWTNLIDSGVVASSTAGQVVVSVTIDESLTFTLANSSVVLNTPTVSSTGTGTSSMTISTNAASGYSLSYSGNTLTSGVNTITPMASPAASVVNTRQFGLNLMNNVTPAVGSAKSGTGSGIPASGYDISDQFKFNTSGDVVASASMPTNTNTFITSYVVNMDGSTAAGAYSTIITYVATANF